MSIAERVKIIESHHRRMQATHNLEQIEAYAERINLQKMALLEELERIENGSNQGVQE